MRDLWLHDIRTPLATICGYTQLLRRRASTRLPTREELFGTLESIEWAARRAEHLLDELAHVCEFDANDDLSARRNNVDLVELSLRMADELLPPGRRRITVLPSVPELVGCWQLDQLEHVLVNLFGNALKYSRHERDVLVTIRRRDDWAVLAVCDEGILAGLGGTITLESQLGAGTRATVRLPIAAA
jgi:signal transduction histidine kinase